MHYQLEVIMPPDDQRLGLSIEDSLEQILKPFYEGDDENRHAFYDFYLIGGRYHNEKLIQSVGDLDPFYDWLKKEQITVSGLQFGKQELMPASNIPKVDSKWNEMFPPKDGIFIPCPLFAHSSDRYSKQVDPANIWQLKDCDHVTCFRCIVAGIDYSDKALEAKFMIEKEYWNGVGHMKTVWDGKIKTALEMIADKFKNYNPEYIAKNTPKDDWLIVTVDYHN